MSTIPKQVTILAGDDGLGFCKRQQTGIAGQAPLDPGECVLIPGGVGVLKVAGLVLEVMQRGIRREFIHGNGKWKMKNGKFRDQGQKTLPPIPTGIQNTEEGIKSAQTSGPSWVVTKYSISR